MNRVQRQFILDALDQEEKLSEWEHRFIHSIADLPDDVELSEKQNQILNKIQRKLD